MALRCVIIDDSDRFLEAAREALENDGIAVVGVAGDSAGGLRRIHELRPDVALIDVCLGRECGLTLAERVAAPDVPPDTKVILVSTYAESDFDDLIAVNSALAFLPKTELSGAAIRAILDREPPEDPAGGTGPPAG